MSLIQIQDMWDNAFMESIIHTTTSTKTDAPLVDSRRRSSNGHYFQHSFLEIKATKMNRSVRNSPKEGPKTPHDLGMMISSNAKVCIPIEVRQQPALVMDQLQAGL